MSAPVEIQITVGRFTLRLGSAYGTSVTPTGKPDRDQAEALADAIATRSRVERRSGADVVSDVVGRAAEATAGVERANDLVAALAKGLTLDPKVLEKEANALLDLLDRADREGRWEDEHRLARALVVLLALIPRWVALIEVLRRTASAAAAVGDRATEAWANHEIGSFALAADDVEVARQHLNRALAVRNSLADRAGTDATLHNMEMLALAKPLPPRQTRSLRGSIARHPVVAGLTALVVLAGGFAASGGDLPPGEPSASPTKKVVDESETITNQSGATTPERPDTTTEESQTETRESDTVKPTVRMDAPGQFVSDVVTLTASAQDAGGSKVDAVIFEVAQPGTDAWEPLGEDANEPYSLDWDTTILKDGQYNVRATAVDGAQNQRSSAPSSTLVDNSPPETYLGSPSSAAGGKLTLSAKAVDDGSGIQVVTFELAWRLDKNSPWGEWQEVGTGRQPVEEIGWPYEFELNTNAEPSGYYRFRAKASDRAGHTGVSESGTFTITHVE